MAMFVVAEHDPNRSNLANRKLRGFENHLL
ncbi:hypothetical protein SAMN05421772_1231 [Paracoccus saliphilus]|uniref:Uncharacterized protein n=1 Tax=Paracoccus saliphilus TaxID=405559 RepID=A0AA46A7I2_9RHOB|nr:hypothetical protein SAMN05421772_1231 [Paracoccus saliphilus]